MKTFIGIIMAATLVGLGAPEGKAQLAQGAAAPNWTLSDINGNSYTLFNILAQGKNVVLDVSATWCGPCWQYHQSGELENFYQAEGPNGTDKARVFFIEGDGSTNSADLHGTGSNTNGDWVTGTPYPIIDPPSPTIDNWETSYNIGYFPTVYVICNNQKVYEVTTNNMTQADINAVIAQHCPATTLVETHKGKLSSVYPNPVQSHSVFVGFTVYEEAAVNISVTDVLCRNIVSSDLGKISGFQNYEINLPPCLENGIYFVNIRMGNELITQKISVNR